jgi:2-iminobutanoate/2-iminopropanoate deaminase
MPRTVIKSEKAPRAIGPYSPAIQTPLYVFTSGQIGLDPVTGELVAGGVEAETRQALANLSNLLEAAGSSIAAVVKTTVFLRDMADFGKMNAIYAEFFAQDPPARTTVAAAGLPRDAAVEIDAIAYAGE